jgi:hypothetical protein
MSCGAHQPGSPNYTCTYVMIGSEVPPGNEVAQTVLVSVTDAAGNRGQAVGSVVFDFKAPAVVSSSPSPASLKQGDVLVYAINVSEKLAAPGQPLVVVKRAGVTQASFFGAPVTETDTGFTWSRSMSGVADGNYTVEISLTDQAGNSAGPTSATGFAVDNSVPQVEQLTASPARIRGAGTVTVSFNASEAGSVVTTLGAQAMSCGAYQSSSPNYTCTYAMTGAEIAAGTEAAQTVLVRVTDAAGNLGQAVGGVVFDFKAPAVVSSSPNPASLKGGDTLVYTVNVSEKLAAPGRPVLVVRRAGVVQAGFFVAPVIETETSATWQRSASGLSDGAYTVEISLTDQAGNATSAVTGAGFTVDTSVPSLTALSVTPGRLRGAGTLTVRFDSSEAGSASASAGAQAMSCGAYQSSSPNYTCTYAMTGAEIAAGTEAAQTVLVSVTDSAGNRGQALGGVVFDFKLPSLVASSANPSNAKGTDQLVYSVNVSEKLAAPGRPVLVVRRAGVVQAGFFGDPATETDTGFNWSRAISGLTDGAYTVEISLTDEAGNAASAVAGAGFSVDTVVPQVNALNVTPARIRGTGTVTVSFDRSETIPAGGVTAALGSRSMICGAYQATSPHYTCTYAMTGTEITTQTEASQAVLVTMTDAAGNRGQAVSAVVFDFKTPTLVSSSASPTSARQSDQLIYTVNVSEKLAAPGRPVLVVKRAGVIQAGFFTAPASETDTSFTWTRAVSDLSDGAYTVEISLTDLAGNGVSALAGAGFAVDATLPVVSGLVVSPARIRSTGTVTATFNVSETIPAGGVAVTVGTQTMSCGAYQATPPNYTCTYAMVGTEIVTNTEASQSVLVRLTDAAGNRGEASGALVFDFKPPGVGFATVTYQTDPTNPLSRVEAAKLNTEIQVQLSAEELLNGAAVIFSARLGIYVLPFSCTSSTFGASCTATLPAGAPEGDYVPTIDWTDVAGNRNATASFATPVIKVKTSTPTLAVNQNEVTYLRSPWGNGAEELLGAGGFSMPLGAYYALASANPLDPRLTLSGSAFSLGAVAPTLVRLWADAGKSSLMGTAAPNANGTWPRARLANLDAPVLYASGVDHAGNESALVKIENAEWVATPRAPSFGVSPHDAEQTTFALPTLGALAGGAVSGGVDAPEGTAPLVRAETAWSEVIGSSAKPSIRSWHAMAYDSARGRVVIFGGYDSLKRNDIWEWDGVTWVDKTPAGLKPSARYRHAMAYDSARGRVMLFGGLDTNGIKQEDLWEWDGTTWTNKTPAGLKPSARESHAMAYDSARGKLVVFGGDDGGLKNDIWEWDGTSWTDRTPAGLKPSNRHWHAMAHDSARNRVVLFGGEDAVKRNDVWEWDGTSWTDRTPAGLKPSARSWHAMAYDSVRGRAVLVGGHDGAIKNDLWEWDGTSWVDRTPAGLKPGIRFQHGVAYDSARNRTVVFAGEETARKNDVWEWDGASWADRTPAGLKPSARYMQQLAFDVSRSRTVLFAGLDTILKNDVWEWDGVNWVDRTPAGTKPVVRTGHALVYDASRSRVTLFGGYDGSIRRNDTWEWNGTSWVDRTPLGTKPTARYQHAATYDSARSRLVMFGGNDTSNVSKNDVWEWDGTNWYDVTPAGTKPSVRWRHAMAYDAARGRVVLFGGEDQTVRKNDVWEWDGSTWVDKTPAGLKPSARKFHTMAYDSARARVVMFGGDDGGTGWRDDIWEWDGTSWVDKTPTQRNLTGRYLHGMTYDSARSRMVLYGGYDGATMGDTWEWNANGARQPAIQLEASLASAGIEPGVITQMRTRAHCGGVFSPFTALSRGATLYGWATGGPTVGPGQWLPLASNATGLNAAQPYLPGSSTALVEWTSSSAAQAQRFVMERERRAAFQCRSAGSSGVQAQEAAVALDYLEVRVRYRP